MAQLERLPRTATSGWIAGRPDPRDFTLARKHRSPLGLRVLQALDRRAKALGEVGKDTLELPAFGPVRNQGSLNACCAYAGVALMEYRVRRDRGPSDPDCSVGFLYKVTRDLMKTDDAKDGQRDFDGNAPV